MVKFSRASSGAAKRIGISISPNELVAADAHFRDASDRAWRAPLDPPPAENGHWPSLVSAFSDLAQRLNVKDGEGSLAISLASAFAEVRRIELPPVRDDDLQRLLARGASRYFVNARGQQVVGASLAGRRVRGAQVPIIAAAAPARLVAIIRHAAQQTGWTIDVTAPAESAWTAAAFAMWPAFARQRSFVLVSHNDRTDLLTLDDQRLVGVRRFRTGGDDAALIAEAIVPGARVGLFGIAGPRKSLANALSARGLTLSMPTGELATAADSPEELAAHFAGSGVGPQFRSEEALIAERSRTQRVAWRLAGVAAVLFVAAGATELWGVHRQLRLVRAEREKLKPEIASTMVGRTTVETAFRHLSALSAAERAAPRWSSVIGSLSSALPDDAYLLALRTRDDSLIVDGLADHAAPIFTALEKANGLTEIRAAAPVRRELQDGGTTALEHFTIASRVTQTSAPAARGSK